MHIKKNKPKMADNVDVFVTILLQNLILPHKPPCLDNEKRDDNIIFVPSHTFAV